MSALAKAEKNEEKAWIAKTAADADLIARQLELDPYVVANDPEIAKLRARAKRLHAEWWAAVIHREHVADREWDYA